VGPDYAAGLHFVAERNGPSLPLIKGQLTGPVSWGLAVTDSSDRGVIYDDLLADAAARFLKLKARWQESFLKTIAKETVIFIDEPYLASLGSAFVSLPNDQVSALLSEVLSGITGLKGIHCCGGTDWSLLLGLPIDIINFDAYNYLDSVMCYEAELKAFLRKGKAIAWGIVPNDEETLKKESLPSLLERFEEALSRLAAPGLSVEQVASQSLVTPSCGLASSDLSMRQVVSQSIVTPACGLASLSYDAADYVLHLLAQLSEQMRRKYCS
jgi:methionine synthase II (cobalamin-independent)